MAPIDSLHNSRSSPLPSKPSLAGESTISVISGRTGNSARIGFWALAFGFGCLLLWAGLAPLEEGVPSYGQVALDTKSKTLQHLTGGLIQEVLVGEGDYVTQGQLLLRLDDAVPRANFQAARQRYLGSRAVEGRLLAEQRGQVSISFHPDVVEASRDPQIREVVRTQEQLFASRRVGLQAELQSIEESIQGQQGLIQAYESMLANRKSQSTLLTEELESTRALVNEGYVPRNRQLELERMRFESGAGIAELQGNTVRAKKTVAELRQKSIFRQQEFRKDVETRLADIARDVMVDAEKYRVAKDDLERVEIKSPATGQVVGLAFQTVGGVIGAGQRLMDIVPQGHTLIVEAQVPPHLIDRVHKGLTVDIRFSSFAHSPQLVVDGKLVTISADVMVDPKSGMGYYLARVGVTAEGLRKLGKRQLQPGMPVEVIFLTGERSLLTYLLSPLSKRVAASLKEE